MAGCRVGTIYINSTHRLDYKNVKDVDGNFINSGTATYTLKDKETGSTIATGSLAYLAASSGVYRGMISNSVTVGLEERKHYTLVVLFTGPTGEVAEDHQEYEARYQ